MIINYSLFNKDELISKIINIIPFNKFLKETDRYNNMISHLMKNYYANKYQGKINLGLHNKPIILDDNMMDSVYISISHTDEICLGIETLSNHIGIDIEKNKDINQELSCFIDDEPKTIKQWTKKEAYVKMTGIGISDLNNFKIINNKVWRHIDNNIIKSNHKYDSFIKLDHNVISFSVKLNDIDYIISVCGNWDNNEIITFEELTLDLKNYDTILLTFEKFISDFNKNEFYFNKKKLFEIVHKDNPEYINLIDEYTSEFYSIKLDNSDYKIIYNR